MSPELHITLPDGRTIRRPLGAEAATIGRDAACEIPIDDPSASRRHARFISTGQIVTIEDLGSKNGTLVNDGPCRTTLLRDGDRVLLGATVIVYRDRPGTASTSVVVSDDATMHHSTRYSGRDQKPLLSQRRLEMIYELSERLTTLQSQDQLLQGAMDICGEMLQFERGAIGIRRRNQKALDWPIVRNLRGAEGEITISRSLLSRALERGERAIFTDAGGGTVDPTMSIVQQGIRSAMCVPLLQGSEVIGIIYGDRSSTATAYQDEDIDFFAAIARQISIGLINSRLLEDQQQMARLHRDLDLARSIQGGLFPASLPNRQGLRVAALNDPGRRVSGDYYDVIEIPDGRIWFLIADVTGEGVGAAIQMAHFQAAVRVTISESEDPAVLLAKWNDFVCRNTQSGRFITCLLGLLDPKSRTLRLASAGHLEPFVCYRDAAPMMLEVNGGFPLGVVPSSSFEQSEFVLRPSALWLAYTDGVTEALDPDGKTFGIDKLKEAILSSGELQPGPLIKQLRKRVSAHAASAEQSDDITLLATSLD
ncbi:MAG: SpoIIE family protein phosphatase [Planctomycetes bacterium]|nr:SpoIIE family protein phosphatase [Planctomycetota bacterium]